MRLFIKVLASLQVILEFFIFYFYFSKQMGMSGDGKRSIKLGWPSVKKKKIYCKNEILFIHVPRTFLLENGRGGKALRMRVNPDSV